MLSKDEWRKLRDVINAWPDDSDRIRLHRVINRELDPEANVTWGDGQALTTARLVDAPCGGHDVEQQAQEVPLQLSRQDARQSQDR
jgi:hypothetical protein